MRVLFFCTNQGPRTPCASTPQSSSFQDRDAEERKHHPFCMSLNMHNEKGISQNKRGISNSITF
jgi:hypothetical protein